MNQIEAKAVMTPWGYEQEYPTVDGKTIAAHLSEWMASENETDCEWLYPAWGNALLVTAEKNLIWHLIDCEDTVNVPILVCEDDLDLSCIVVLAKIRKTQNRVYWDAVGFWRKEHCTDDIRLYGILHHESYSDEDWVRYGGNIACAEIDSEQWRQWIGDHWEEENRRRMMNYIKPHLQDDSDVLWVAYPHWSFDREQYEKCVDDFRKRLKEQETDFILGEVNDGKNDL